MKELEYSNQSLEPRCKKGIITPTKIWVYANVFWYFSMILIGYILHCNQVLHYVLPLLVLTFMGGILGAFGLSYSVRNSLCLMPIKEEHFNSGSFVEKLRSEVKVVVAQIDICVLAEWKIARGFPLPSICKEIPLVKKLTEYRDSTTVRLVAKDNKVQYYVQLEDITEESVTYDSVSGTLTLDIPYLTLDQDLIQVQTDPSKIWIMSEKGFYDTMADWIRSDEHKISALMLNKLKPLVIQEANSPEKLQIASKNAQPQLEYLLRMLVDKTDLKVNAIRIQFHKTLPESK